ncbi:MAG TPA: NAD(P)-binding domain-containing protein [Acidimicrobiales bacterium]|nr:NAD(P)-binding domain-containing protein [Acidimicrobiales bacterium]
MRFGICGLGRMGSSLGMQALEKGHEVVGFDPGGSEELQAARGTVVESIAALADALVPPRVALVYVPHGDPTEQVVSELAGTFDAMDKEIAVPLLAQAVWGFYESRDPDRSWARTVALLRHEHGNHPLQGQAGSDS